ncbi:unnamed protein product [Darwinula stevensoni]|uniref:Uncharacterized protein n=1 Tax=Darwinula stevensoni TaxID=69355 RepID=A0A7R9A3Z3_9CRUS|nr:unnamed protein product [Darwinula stevensoni]CAG0883190.1 unnamed protein product [Darwinula stevensoni]
MTLRLEDFLIDKKKEAAPLLDLSKTKIQTQDDLEKLIARLPDLKIRPEKSMRNVRIQDLSAVDIDWRMLTLQRPKSKVEEDIFSRLVSLDKGDKKARSRESGPPVKQLIRTKSKPRSKAAVVPETKFQTCRNCAEELCSGACREFGYEAFERVILEEKEKEGGLEKKDLDLATLLGGGAVSSRLRRDSHRKLTKKRKKKKKKKKTTQDDQGGTNVEDEADDAPNHHLSSLLLQPESIS